MSNLQKYIFQNFPKILLSLKIKAISQNVRKTRPVYIHGVRMPLHTELVESNLYNKTRFPLTRIYYDNVQDD